MIMSILITVILLAICGAMEYLTFPKLKNLTKQEKEIFSIALIMFNIIIVILLVALNITCFNCVVCGA